MKNNSVPEDNSIHPLLLEQLDGYLKKMLHPTNTQWTGAVIIGKTGAGKTFLIENYLQNTPCDVLISNQSTQLQNVPYAGFKLAVGNYLRSKVKEMDAASFASFSEGLTQALGADFELLCEYIPELMVLEGTSSMQGSQAPKMENQLYSLFKVLFEYFSDFSNQVLILFTDDLQWIDGSSASMLQYLLTHLPPSKLLWLGAVRDSKEEMGQVDQLISSLGFDQKHIQRIELGEFSLEQTTLFIEKGLKGACDPDTSVMLHKLGKGNPALLTTLLDTLVQENLLIYSGGTWVGDIQKIEDRYRGVNANQLFIKRLDSLDESSLKILTLVACSDAIDEVDLFALTEEIPHAKETIDRLISNEVLEISLGKIEFVDSYFGEFIYSRLSEKEKSRYHLEIYKVLLHGGFYQLSHSEKVIIAQHLQLALGSVSAVEDKVSAASVILEVARIQKNENAFTQAKQFLKASLDLLKGLRWADAKDILFQTHLESAKIEYLLGEYDLAEIQLDYLIENLINLKQRSEAFELKIVINNHLGRYRKAVVILQEILLELGMRLPMDEESLQKEIQGLQGLIILDSSLPSALFSDLQKDNQSAVLRLLYVGGMAMHHTSETLMTWAALQLILRSRFFDLPNVSTIGFASYGRMRVISGDLSGGFEFGKKAVEINTSLHDMQYRCRVLGVFAFYIQPWKKAFEESTALLVEGMEAGRKSGDLIGFYILKTHLFNLHFISGKPISGLLSYQFKESYPGMELTYYITHYQKELIRYLTTESPFLSLPKQEPGGLAAKLTLQEELFYRHYVLARYFFLFGYYDQARNSARVADQNKKLQAGSPLVPANVLILCLSITQNWANLNPAEKEENLSWLEGVFIDLTIWCHHAPDNYASDYWLLKAELGRITDAAHDQLVNDYYKASECAGSNLYQSALSNELAGKFFLSINDFSSAKSCLQEAVRYYGAWEAKRKVRQLVRQYSFLYDAKIKDENPLDIENILREMGGEMDVEIITKKLLTILLRVSASTAVTIQFVDQKGLLDYRKEMRLLKTADSTSDSFLVDLSGLFLMAYRTKSPMIFDELESDSGYPELKLLSVSGVKSCMIFPVGISESLSMLVYLESSFATANYTSEIIRWIRIVSSQGGLILENAKSYERSLALNEEVKQEVLQKQDLMNLLEHQKNAHIKDLMKVQEHERERIAGELHDSLGSQLSTIKIRLANLFEKYGDISLQHEGNEALDKLDSAIGEVRRIAHHMSPVSLRRFGLSLALQSLLEEINDSTIINADLQVLGLETRLEEQIELTVYRICQELIQNVLKHSKATQLRLQLIKHEDLLNITVEDNGIGIQKERKYWGMGLLGIEAKVEMLKGKFSFESQAERGCLIVIDFPV